MLGGPIDIYTTGEHNLLSILESYLWLKNVSHIIHFLGCRTTKYLLSSNRLDMYSWIREHEGKIHSFATDVHKYLFENNFGNCFKLSSEYNLTLCSLLTSFNSFLPYHIILSTAFANPQKRGKTQWKRQNYRKIIDFYSCCSYTKMTSSIPRDNTNYIYEEKHSFLPSFVYLYRSKE